MLGISRIQIATGILFRLCPCNRTLRRAVDIPIERRHVASKDALSSCASPQSPAPLHAPSPPQIYCLLVVGYHGRNSLDLLLVIRKIAQSVPHRRRFDRGCRGQSLAKRTQEYPRHEVDPEKNKDNRQKTIHYYTL